MVTGQLDGESTESGTVPRAVCKSTELCPGVAQVYGGSISRGFCCCLHTRSRLLPLLPRCASMSAYEPPGGSDLISYLFASCPTATLHSYNSTTEHFPLLFAVSFFHDPASYSYGVRAYEKSDTHVHTKTEPLIVPLDRWPPHTACHKCPTGADNAE